MHNSLSSQQDEKLRTTYSLLWMPSLCLPRIRVMFNTFQYLNTLTFIAHWISALLSMEVLTECLVNHRVFNTSGTVVSEIAFYYNCIMKSYLSILKYNECKNFVFLAGSVFFCLLNCRCEMHSICLLVCFSVCISSVTISAVLYCPSPFKYKIFVAQAGSNFHQFSWIRLLSSRIVGESHHAQQLSNISPINLFIGLCVT